MAKDIDNKFESHLEDALKQQDFLKGHLGALKQYLAVQKEGKPLPPDALEKSYKHLLALNANQQIIINDILAVQQELLTSPEFIHFAETHIDEINEESIGAIRRAHEPMLQLIRDNESLLQKLLKVWKNLCHFLGLNLNQTMEKNLDNLNYQLGFNSIRYELNAFNLALKQLENQQYLIDKKIKSLSLALSRDHHLSEEELEYIKTFIEDAKLVLAQTLVLPEALAMAEEGLEETLDERKALQPELKPGEVLKPALAAELPKPIEDGVNLRLRKHVNYMPQALMQYDWSIPEPRLTDEHRQNLEHFLGIEQTHLSGVDDQPCGPAPLKLQLQPLPSGSGRSSRYPAPFDQ